VRGPHRRGAQCSCIGCIGLRPALKINAIFFALETWRTLLSTGLFPVTVVINTAKCYSCNHCRSWEVINQVLRRSHHVLYKHNSCSLYLTVAFQSQKICWKIRFPFLNFWFGISHSRQMLAVHELFLYWTLVKLYDLIFYPITSKVWCFMQIFIFPPLFNAPVRRWPFAVIADALSRCLFFFSAAFP